MTAPGRPLALSRRLRGVRRGVSTFCPEGKSHYELRLTGNAVNIEDHLLRQPGGLRHSETGRK